VEVTNDHSGRYTVDHDDIEVRPRFPQEERKVTAYRYLPEVEIQWEEDGYLCSGPENLRGVNKEVNQGEKNCLQDDLVEKGRMRLGFAE